jgi:hypothetical protein
MINDDKPLDVVAFLVFRPKNLVSLSPQQASA